MERIHREEPIFKSVQDKINALRAATVIRQWRSHVGASEGAESPDYNDQDWEAVALPYTWSSAGGERWFRTTVNLPPQVEGIPLAGSTIELEIMLTIGAAIYLDGQELYRERSWSDTRAVQLVLIENYEPGSPLHLAVRCNGGDGFGLFVQANLRIDTLADVVLDLDLTRMQTAFTRFLVEKEGHNRSARVSIWEKAASTLDLEALNANRWDAWRSSTEAAQATLAPFADEAKGYIAHLVAHSHIDMNWLWPWDETVEVCKRDFAAMDRLMDAYPEFRFSQSQAATYHAIEQHQPSLFERIKARVTEGRWDVTATTWVEGDQNMAAGETLVRQVLHARRYMREHFGVVPPICWEPDTFGHVATLPQILKKSGVQFYYFCRAGKGHPLFWWEGLDGSRVLAVQDPRGYNGTVNPAEVVESVIDFGGRYGIRRGLHLYGAGDHGGGATARDIETARLINATPCLPKAQPSSTLSFYQKALAEADELPVVRGELNTVFEGCYTSHGDIKRMNRDSENGLLTAEASATLAAVLADESYPLGELAEAWRTLCFHQFHDILCGCAIGVTYRQARERLAEVMETIDRTSVGAMNALAAATDTGDGNGPRIVVFNPLAWERTDLVCVPLQMFGGVAPAAVADDAGRVLPVQRCGDEAIFIAQALPSLGIRVYRPVDQAAAEDGEAIRVDADSNTMNNGHLRLRVHPESGALDELVDLQGGRNLAGPWAGAMAERKINAGWLNRLQIVWEQPHPMSAWNIGDTTRVDHLITGAEVKVLEHGPVRGVIEVRRHFLNSSLMQRIVLYRGLRRIDFETVVDWHEQGNAQQDAPMLRTTFAPFLEQSHATFEIPFAGLERPADGREVPALRWSDLSEQAYGVSLLNDGKYGHQAHGNTLGLTLVRASYEPDNNPDEGVHRFTYSLYPHPGDWREAGTGRRAAELNQPVQVAVTTGHPGKVPPGRPGVICQPEGAMVTALKLAEDQPEQGRDIILRIVEMHGQAAEVTLRVAWPIVQAEEVDMVEQPTADLSFEGDTLRLALTPHEIKTVKLHTV